MIPNWCAIRKAYRQLNIVPAVSLLCIFFLAVVQSIALGNIGDCGASPLGVLVGRSKEGFDHALSILSPL